MVVKKAGKKKVIRRTSKRSSISKMDFEAFKFGVERLKEIERELNSLDTRNFASEERDIRGKLKDISQLPYIERKFRELKLKINRKYKPQKRRAKSSAREIKKEFVAIKSELKKIGQSKKFSEPGLGKIQEQLEGIKKAHEEDSKIIRKSAARQRIPVDDDVDILVDTKFSSFLNEIKKALSERIDKKEKEIDKQAEIDLQERDLKYKKKHDMLLSDFEREKERLEKLHKKALGELLHKREEFEKESQKRKKNLEKEYQKKFEERLEKKFSEEKGRIDREYKLELKRLARIELENQKRKIYRTLKEKENILKDKEEKEIKEIKEAFAEQMHRELEAELEKKERELKARLENEYDLRLKQEIQKHEQEIKKKKIDLELEMQKKIKQVLR